MSPRPFSPYVPRPATLTRKETLSDLVTLFEFEPDNGRPLAHKPGQFIMISRFGIGEAPFSISSAPVPDNHKFEVAVRKIGSVTTAMHNMKVGEKVGLRGPYGTFFPVQNFMGKDTLFVAGGLGLIPLRSLLHYQLRHRDEFGRIIILVGTRSPRERLFVEQLAEMDQRNDIEIHETVDVAEDGWKGNVGVITTLLPKVDLVPDSTYVAMVGPPIMYKFVLAECMKLGLQRDRIYVSLERRMRCGLGKCGHCQINGVNACLDGPVFLYDTIEPLKEAI